MSNSSTSNQFIHWDLLLTGIIVFIVTQLIIYSTGSNILGVIRLVLGLFVVLFVPGYWFVNTLFPLKEDLDGVERIGLSLGLSVAWVTILALILDRLEWGIQQKSILAGELIFILVFMGFSLMRRINKSPNVKYVPEFSPPKKWWSGQGGGSKRMILVLTGAISFALVAVSWVLLTPSPADFITEYYILGPDRLAEDFPHEAEVGETVSVTLGIVNRESVDHSYRVEIWVEDPWTENRTEQVARVPGFSLQAANLVEFPVSWSMPWSGEDQVVEFLLFIDDQAEPYRNLRLWMNVVDSGE